MTCPPNQNNATIIQSNHVRMQIHSSHPGTQQDSTLNLVEAEVAPDLDHLVDVTVEARIQAMREQNNGPPEQGDCNDNNIVVASVDSDEGKVGKKKFYILLAMFCIVVIAAGTTFGLLATQPTPKHSSSPTSPPNNQPTKKISHTSSFSSSNNPNELNWKLYWLPMRRWMSKRWFG